MDVSQLKDIQEMKKSFGTSEQTPKECLQQVLFNSIKREHSYNEFKLDV